MFVGAVVRRISYIGLALEKKEKKKTPRFASTKQQKQHKNVDNNDNDEKTHFYFMLIKNDFFVRFCFALRCFVLLQISFSFLAFSVYVCLLDCSPYV